MTIDWTKPVKCSNGMDAEPLFDATGSVRACLVGSVVYSHAAFDRLILRNVQPPKPVLMERWVNLYRTRMSSGFETEERATAVADHCDGGRVECRRITWMSDGSPVPGWEQGSSLFAEYTKLSAERDKWRDSANDALDELKAANDRIEQLSPVVEAAVVWERHFSAQASERLVGAVRDYLRDVAYPKKTAEGAVANVAAMMEPVKSCKTCRWRDSQAIACRDLRGCRGTSDNYSAWEAK